MPVDVAALPPLQRRRHMGTAIEDIADAADRHGIKNTMDGFGIVMPALMPSLDPYAIRRRHVPIGHRNLLYSGANACEKSGLMKRATSQRDRQSTFGEAALAGLSLDRADREPLHRQLASELKRLILAHYRLRGAPAIEPGL